MIYFGIYSLLQVKINVNIRTKSDILCVQNVDNIYINIRDNEYGKYFIKIYAQCGKI